MLPLTITMSELNANEKYFYLSSKLPNAPEKGGNIKVGDLMLYQNNCLVLFYDGFNTEYRYTRVGRLENVNKLKEALGKVDIAVRFEIE